MNTTAVARHLNIAEAAIVKVEEWAHVLFVRFVSGRPRFVSKKAVKMEKIEFHGISLEKRSHGLVTSASNFKKDWETLKSLEFQGIAKRVGLGVAYKVQGVTFVNRELYVTDPVTCVQTSENWFAVVQADLEDNFPPVWDPREQSSDWDPEDYA